MKRTDTGIDVNILITGGAGYIGAVLSLQAAADGHQVKVLDSISPDSDVIKFLLKKRNISYFQGDFSDPVMISGCINGTDCLMHLAGVSDGRAGKKDPEATFKINAEAVKSLVNISKEKKIKRLLFASTVGVYGNLYRVSLQEDLPLNPSDPYSASKAAAEKILEDAHSESFCTTSLRISMVFGWSPKMRTDFLVNQMTLNAIEQGRIEVQGGNQIRPQVHIRDVCSAFLKLAKTSSKKINGESFNVVSLNPSVSHIAEEIRKILPATEIVTKPSRENEDSFVANGDLLFDTTGFRPDLSLDYGISEIIENYYHKKYL